MTRRFGAIDGAKAGPSELSSPRHPGLVPGCFLGRNFMCERTQLNFKQSKVSYCLSLVCRPICHHPASTFALHKQVRSWELHLAFLEPTPRSLLHPSSAPPLLSLTTLKRLFQRSRASTLYIHIIPSQFSSSTKSKHVDLRRGYYQRRAESNGQGDAGHLSQRRAPGSLQEAEVVQRQISSQVCYVLFDVVTI